MKEGGGEKKKKEIEHMSSAISGKHSGGTRGDEKLGRNKGKE
jgi:hypothetical protein